MGKKYICTFIGRTSGAIGITYPITAFVWADNEKEAELKLYDKYEHISQLSIRTDNVL